MKIALFEGKSFESRVIRFLTRSVDSHACFVFDHQTATAIQAIKQAGIALPKIVFPVAGAVIEAWDSSVRNVISVSVQHTPGTVVRIYGLQPSLTVTEEIALIRMLHSDIGDGHDWKRVRHFLTRKPDQRAKRRWFSSEHVSQRLADCGRPLFNAKAWEIPPARIAWSPVLHPHYVRMLTR